MTKEPDNLKLKDVLDSTVKFRSTVRQFALNPPLSLPGTVKSELKFTPFVHLECMPSARFPICIT